MGDTNISGLGKILSGKEMSIAGGHLKDDDAKAGFSEFMAQSGVNNFAGQNLYQTEMKIPQRVETDLESTPTADYEKFQYKDNKIPEKMEYKDMTENNVVEEKMTEFTEAVEEVLKEELGVTEEEITSAMEALGISYTDLLNQNNLANLVAKLSGSKDICSLLCNEQFVTILQDVNVLGKELLQELGMSMEELMNFLDAQNMMTANAGTYEEVSVNVSDTANVEEAQQMASENTSDISKTTDAAEKAAALEENVTISEKADAAQNTTEDKMLSADNLADAQNNNGVRLKSEAPEDGRKITDGNVTDNVEEAPLIVTETVANDGQEESFDNMSQQNSLLQETSVEEMPEEHTHSQTFRQVIKDVNEQAIGGVQMNQNAAPSAVNPADAMQSMSNIIDVREIMNQLVEAARVTVSSDMSKMQMQLNPENLGKMYLEIVENDGVISAKIQLQNEAVKEAVEAQIVELKQNLNQAGVKVDAVEVTVASHEFEKNLEQDAKQEERQAAEQEKSAKQRRINLNDLDELSGVMSDEETLVAKIMAEQGNSIDYTA